MPLDQRRRGARGVAAPVGSTDGRTDASSCRRRRLETGLDAAHVGRTPVVSASHAIVNERGRPPAGAQGPCASVPEEARQDLGLGRHGGRHDRVPQALGWLEVRPCRAPVRDAIVQGDRQVRLTSGGPAATAARARGAGPRARRGHPGRRASTRSGGCAAPVLERTRRRACARARPGPPPTTRPSPGADVPLGCPRPGASVRNHACSPCTSSAGRWAGSITLGTAGPLGPSPASTSCVNASPATGPGRSRVGDHPCVRPRSSVQLGTRPTSRRSCWPSSMERRETRSRSRVRERHEAHRQDERDCPFLPWVKQHDDCLRDR